jgi:hypothetical protein
MLTENGAQFAEIRDKVRNIRESLDTAAIALLRQARLAIERVWPRLQSHRVTPEVASSVEKLKAALGSEDFINSWGDIAQRTKTVLDTYKHHYIDLFEKRMKAYGSAIEEIRNRPEWRPLEDDKNREIAHSLLSSLIARVGTPEEKDAVASGESLGKSSLAEMESDLCAVDGLKSSVLVKLQELSIGGDRKAPVRRVRLSEFFNRPIQTKDELDKALDLLRDSLQKHIDEGAIIILE